MKEFAVYTALRLFVFIGLYAVIGGGFYLVFDGISPLWPLLIAAVASTWVSTVLLKERRDRLVQHLSARADRAARAAEAAEEAAEKED